MPIQELNKFNIFDIFNFSKSDKAKTHSVAKGETLFSVAKAYGVSVEELKKANKLKNNNLSLNMVLTIPKSKKSPNIFNRGQTSSTKGINMFKDVSDDELKFQQERSKFVKIINNKDYKVKNGDTPEKIADKFGVNTKRLLDVNHLQDDTIINIDKILKIPDAYKAYGVKNVKDLSKATGLSENYLNELINLEKFHNSAYKDKNGNVTIGVGHKVNPNEMSKFKHAKLSNGQVYTMLAQDLINREQNIKSIIGYGTYKKMPQPVKDAVMDFVFNRGEGIFEDNISLINSLKVGKYPEAIAKLNVDYSFVKNKNGNETKKYMSGLSKRRLFEIAHASKIFNGKIPSIVINSAQNIYTRGLYFMSAEKNNGSLPKDAYNNVKSEYNELTKQWFNGKIKLR